MSKPFTHFAQKLKELREKAKLSTYRLAQLAGLTRQALDLLESGERQPAWVTVQKLAKALGVSCEAFEDPGLELPEAPQPGKAGRPKKASEEKPEQPPQKGKKPKSK